MDEKHTAETIIGFGCRILVFVFVFFHTGSDIQQLFHDFFTYFIGDIFFLSFFPGFLRPNLIIGLSGWRAPD